MTQPLPLVLAITGASGAPYALRLLGALLSAQLTISPSGREILRQELDVDVPLDAFDGRRLFQTRRQRPWWERFDISDFDPPSIPDEAQHASLLRYWHYQDFLSPIASGSYLTGGMIICPCSGGTLSGVVTGASGNLIERAAEVHLKESRKLILVPRETPVSVGYLHNLWQAASNGAVVLPAMPGWYHGVRRLHDLVDFVVARILDQLEVPHTLMCRWGSEGQGHADTT
jgi:flavin prenyltransferase